MSGTEIYSTGVPTPPLGLFKLTTVGRTTTLGFVADVGYHNSNYDTSSTDQDSGNAVTKATLYFYPVETDAHVTPLADIKAKLEVVGATYTITNGYAYQSGDPHFHIPGNSADGVYTEIVITVPGSGGPSTDYTYHYLTPNTNENTISIEIPWSEQPADHTTYSSLSTSEIDINLSQGDYIVYATATNSDGQSEPAIFAISVASEEPPAPIVFAETHPDYIRIAFDVGQYLSGATYGNYDTKPIYGFSLQYYTATTSINKSNNSDKGFAYDGDVSQYVTTSAANLMTEVIPEPLVYSGFNSGSNLQRFYVGRYGEGGSYYTFMGNQTDGAANTDYNYRRLGDTAPDAISAVEGNGSVTDYHSFPHRNSPAKNIVYLDITKEYLTAEYLDITSSVILIVKPLYVDLATGDVATGSIGTYTRLNAKCAPPAPVALPEIFAPNAITYSNNPTIVSNVNQSGRKFKASVKDRLNNTGAGRIVVLWDDFNTRLIEDGGNYTLEKHPFSDNISGYIVDLYRISGGNMVLVKSVFVDALNDPQPNFYTGKPLTLTDGSTDLDADSKCLINLYSADRAVPAFLEPIADSDVTTLSTDIATVGSTYEISSDDLHDGYAYIFDSADLMDTSVGMIRDKSTVLGAGLTTEWYNATDSVNIAITASGYSPNSPNPINVSSLMYSGFPLEDTANGNTSVGVANDSYTVAITAVSPSGNSPAVPVMNRNDTYIDLTAGTVRNDEGAGPFWLNHVIPKRMPPITSSVGLVVDPEAQTLQFDIKYDSSGTGQGELLGFSIYACVPSDTFFDSAGDVSELNITHYLKMGSNLGGVESGAEPYPAPDYTNVYVRIPDVLSLQSGAEPYPIKFPVWKPGQVAAFLSNPGNFPTINCSDLYDYVINAFDNAYDAENENADVLPLGLGSQLFFRVKFYSYCITDGSMTNLETATAADLIETNVGTSETITFSSLPLAPKLSTVDVEYSSDITGKTITLSNLTIFQPTGTDIHVNVNHDVSFAGTSYPLDTESNDNYQGGNLNIILCRIESPNYTVNDGTNIFAVEDGTPLGDITLARKDGVEDPNWDITLIITPLLAYGAAGNLIESAPSGSTFDAGVRVFEGVPSIIKFSPFPFVVPNVADCIKGKDLSYFLSRPENSMIRGKIIDDANANPLTSALITFSPPNASSLNNIQISATLNYLAGFYVSNATEQAKITSENLSALIYETLPTDNTLGTLCGFSSESINNSIFLYNPCAPQAKYGVTVDAVTDSFSVENLDAGSVAKYSIPDVSAGDIGVSNRFLMQFLAARNKYVITPIYKDSDTNEYQRVLPYSSFGPCFTNALSIPDLKFTDFYRAKLVGDISSLDMSGITGVADGNCIELDPETDKNLVILPEGFYVAKLDGGGMGNNWKFLVKGTRAII